MITYTTQGPGVYDVHYENGVRLGQFLQKEDGFYDFWPELRGGYWPEYILRLIADALQELNKEWQEEIEKFEEQERKKREE